MVLSASIVQELIPQLSASLGQLRRVPGRNDLWVPQVIVALEKAHDPRFDRMRRRIGFAQRLGTIAALPAEAITRATVGLFFLELLPAHSNGAKAGRAWREYLLRNEDWLRPAFEVCEAVRYKTWTEMEEGAEIIAKIAVVYDAETLDHHERPLAVVESIMEDVEGRDAQRIVDLLWTEDGQTLCDHHFRRHPAGYKLDSQAIRAGLAKLYRAAPRPAVSSDIQSMRLGDAARPITREMEVEEHVSQIEKQNGRADNFDQRRQALRTRPADAEQLNDTLTDNTDEPQPATGIEAKLRALESKEQRSESSGVALDGKLPGEKQVSGPAAAGQKREERMNQLATISPPSNARGDALELRERLQELRLQLGQIQQLAVQAEQLLSGITPQIDEFATQIADVEAVMDRWSGRGRAAA